MNTLQQIWKRIVYGFAAFGAFMVLCGGVSMLWGGASVKPKEPPQEKVAQGEIPPRLNWQAADQALTQWLDDIQRRLAFQSDALPVWQSSTPIHEHRLPPISEAVWRPLSIHQHQYCPPPLIQCY